MWNVEDGDAAGVEKRTAIFVGPEFGTVSRPDLVAAAREVAASRLAYRRRLPRSCRAMLPETFDRIQQCFGAEVRFGLEVL